MPGIDGWETIRRLRALAKDGPVPLPHIAIVSANAFDKGLDNDVEVPADDFILKPVRHSEMLDWLANRLQLTWLEAPSRPPRWRRPAQPPPRSGRPLPNWMRCATWWPWVTTVAY